MRLFAAAGLALLLAVPLVAQEGPASQEDRIRQQLEAELRKELAALRETLARTVQKELEAARPGRKPAAAAPAPAVPKALEDALGLITEDLLREHATYLASDELEGRNAGYPGNDKAAEYIAGKLREYGIPPAGDNDEDGRPTYFQKFSLGRRSTRNVVAKIEGSDPELKKEIVVVGAHYDHLGTAAQGHMGRMGPSRDGDRIWNGADDNGSGTTALLGLARAFGEGRVRLKRSLLFLWFSAEEGGLIGSKFYVRNPIAPLATHTFMLNLDMVGRNPDRPVDIQGYGSAEGDFLRKVAEDAVQRSGVRADLKESPHIPMGDSDHSSFRDQGVPVLFFFTGLHADYHKVTDHPEKLAYPNMVRIARTAAYILAGVGNAEESLKYRNLRSSFEGMPGTRRKLGVRAKEAFEAEYRKLGLADDAGAILVEEITEGSVAREAGIEPGDFILRIGDNRFDRGSAFADMRSAVGKVEAGEEVEIEVVRDGARRILKATWDE